MRTDCPTASRAEWDRVPRVLTTSTPSWRRVLGSKGVQLNVDCGWHDVHGVAGKVGHGGLGVPATRRNIKVVAR